MEQLLISGESVFVYDEIAEMYGNHRFPRNKVCNLVNNGLLIRLKQGVYLKNPKISGTYFSREHVASRLYPDSYVSLQYALQYYDLIPEAVHEVTSVTPGNNKRFDTPEGRYSYRSMKRELYDIGTLSVSDPYGKAYKIASPEKALADMLYFEKPFDSRDELLDYVINGLRIDEDDLSRMNADLIMEIAAEGNRRNLRYLSEWLENAA